MEEELKGREREEGEQSKGIRGKSNVSKGRKGRSKCVFGRRRRRRRKEKKKKKN